MDNNIKSVGIIIQARMNSLRFKGKVLRKLPPYADSDTVLGKIVKRSRIDDPAEFIFSTIVATSTNEENDAIESHLKHYFAEVQVYRGDEDNVLSRYVQIQEDKKFDFIIRLTADNPCIHHKQILETLNYHIENGNQYTYSKTNPIGMNVEVASGEVFENLNMASLSNEEKEHVTLHVRHGDYKCGEILGQSYDDIRLTMDEELDYFVQCALFSHFTSNDFDLNAILNLKEEKPWIFQINKSVCQKSFSFVDEYKCLNKRSYISGQHTLVPIRYQDRMDIIRWRNEQIYHLRQAKPLTEEDQDKYFNEVVANLFEQEQPNQILFSYLENDKCIGYGGLVHINWIDKNAEISFIMATELEKEHFHFHWQTYLSLLEKVAFEELGLHKVFTYAFDLRPHLYEAVEEAGYIKEAVLKEHCLLEGEFKDVVIHSKWIPYFLRELKQEDKEITFNWVNNSDSRNNSFNTGEINFQEHSAWFDSKLNDNSADYYLCYFQGDKAGIVRFDIKENVTVIGINISPTHRGKGLSSLFLSLGVKSHMEKFSIQKIDAYIKPENIASKKAFEKAGFVWVCNQIINNQPTLLYRYNRNEP